MHYTKPQTINLLNESFEQLLQASSGVHDAQYNFSKEQKWSTAENVQHLINATRMTHLAFSLPKIFPQLLYGKSNRASHTFTKVVDTYHKKLQQGAKASGLYVPGKKQYVKVQHADILKSASAKLVTAIENKWSEPQLDALQVAHPLLGLVTMRELAYFTIYHNRHHTQTIKELYL